LVVVLFAVTALEVLALVVDEKSVEMNELPPKRLSVKPPRFMLVIRSSAPPSRNWFVAVANVMPLVAVEVAYSGPVRHIPATA
jgi:hypothetical protein